MLQPTCKASRLVERLQELIEKHGDLPVYTDDADTSWRLPIGLVYKPANEAEEWCERFEVKSEYHGRPSGDLSA